MDESPTPRSSSGFPLFITEFGATRADGGVVANKDNNICEEDANNWFKWMAHNSISGVAWKVNQCSDASCILSAAAQPNGPWTDNVLSSDESGTPVDGGVHGGGDGLLIVNWIRE